MIMNLYHLKEFFYIPFILLALEIEEEQILIFDL